MKIDNEKPVIEFTWRVMKVRAKTRRLFGIVVAAVIAVMMIVWTILTSLPSLR